MSLLPHPIRIPRIPLKPPRGFRFGSTPPSLNHLVHLDNDHPYKRARRGEKIRIVEGIISREDKGWGQVVGRMGSRDPRANFTPHPQHWAMPGPEGWAGIYFRNEHGELEWRGAGDFYRDIDGVLRLTR